MPTNRTRYDATVRVVRWLDAFWSAAAVLVGVVGAAALAVLGLPPGGARVVGVTAVVAAAFLAGCGAVAGVLLMLRMNAGGRAAAVLRRYWVLTGSDLSEMVADRAPTRH